jgi:alpha-D-xyloside xylohydrolase
VIARPTPTRWNIEKTNTEMRLLTRDIQVRVKYGTGAVAFYTRQGTPLLAEPAEGARQLTPNRVGGIDTFRSRQAFQLAPGEAVYGLGQHRLGVMNYRGAVVHLQQQNPTESDIPVLVSSKGYGLLWDNPAVTDVNVGVGNEQPIPSSQLSTTDGKPGGLTGQYYQGQDFQTLAGTRMDTQVNFDWSQAPPLTLPHDHYSVRWTGYVQAKHAGEYTFLATADDGVRLWIDDKLLIDNWQSRAAETFSAKVRFEANSRHRIRLEYYQDAYAAIMRLGWRLPALNPDVSWTSEAADTIDYYFMYGPDLDKVVGDYRNLTGAAPMMGQWAWGFWQCKEHYASQQELLDVADRYRSLHIPIDGIIQDWLYWTPRPWGSHEFDTARYPNPAKMVNELHADNVHLLISVWAKFDSGSANFDQLQKAGALYPIVIPYVYPPGKGQWYDPFNPIARRIYWQQISRELFSYGIDGWWLDASEPELSGNWGEYRGYPTAAGSGAKVFNAYPLMHTTSIYAGQRAQTSKKRVFILTRSAYAGQQRNSAVTWSGDISGTWDELARQIPAGLNFSLSGIPYWNTDTGGFFGGNPKDPRYAELFTRWFQFSAFCPMFRVHGTGAPKEMWRFDPRTEQTLVEYDRLRYHLLPYIYSVSWMVTHEGYTMMRPLVMDFRTDRNVYDIADQYLFGPALMVDPVTKAGATARSLYLPAGGSWIDFWTGKSYSGGQSITANSPIDRVPLFVRAGSIIPYGPSIEDAMEKQDPMELRVYRGASGAFTLYEDEGDGYDYEKGAYATIPISWDHKRQVLTIGRRNGSFPELLKKRTFRIVWVAPNHGVGIDSTPHADTTVTYDGHAVEVHVPRAIKAAPS